MAYRGSSTQRRRVNTVADKRLNDFINNNQNLKNQSTNESILSTVSDKPQRFSKDNESRKAFIERNLRADGTPNSAAQAMLVMIAQDHPELSLCFNCGRNIPFHRCLLSLSAVC